jgi:hypothetical protein
MVMTRSFLLLRDGIDVVDDAGVLVMARIRRLDTSVGQPDLGAAARRDVHGEVDPRAAAAIREHADRIAATVSAP